MLTKIKLLFYTFDLKWIEQEIADLEGWLENVTTKDSVYTIVAAKEELTELRAIRLSLGHKITKLKG